MRFLTICAVGLMAVTAAGAQEFYQGPDELPQDGTDRAVLDACWNRIKEGDGLHVLGTEAIMVPQYADLTEDRMARYDLTSLTPGMQYADTTYVVWTADRAGVEFPLAIRCELPFDPQAPDFSRVFLREDESLNPNIPPGERPARD